MTADCAKVPAGWYCTRGAGHEGPCAAWPKAMPDHAGLTVSRETLPEFVYAYHAEVLRWVDGDTVDMRAYSTMDFGFGMKFTPEHTGRFRLTIVNTPERGQPGYHEAIEFVNDVLPVGTVVQIRTYKDPDNWGRYLADILIPGEGTTSISSKLLEYGLGVPYKRL